MLFPMSYYCQNSYCSALPSKNVLHVGLVTCNHGLRTPNEGINQRNLKFWADGADKIRFGRIYIFGIEI